jgi:hypothetical protein
MFLTWRFQLWTFLLIIFCRFFFLSVKSRHCLTLLLLLSKLFIFLFWSFCKLENAKWFSIKTLK